MRRDYFKKFVSSHVIYFHRSHGSKNDSIFFLGEFLPWKLHEEAEIDILDKLPNT